MGESTQGSTGNVGVGVTWGYLQGGYAIGQADRDGCTSQDVVVPEQIP